MTNQLSVVVGVVAGVVARVVTGVGADLRLWLWKLDAICRCKKPWVCCPIVHMHKIKIEAPTQVRG